MIEAPVYAAYAMFDAQNAVRLHKLADETIAVWRDLVGLSLLEEQPGQLKLGVGGANSLYYMPLALTEKLGHFKEQGLNVEINDGFNQLWGFDVYDVVANTLGAGWFYARERVRTGKLDFQDLLVLTARLLRSDERARRELGERFRYLLVDEFQDTDPVQAEVVFLLAAANHCGGDWQRAEPRPGALFVVGDPKQSIYRFRRADIVV
jgi:hypothetical protein